MFSHNLKKKSLQFSKLKQGHLAGLPLLGLFENCSAPTEFVKRLGHGQSLSKAIECLKTLSDFDKRLISQGEKTGRLSDAFERLELFYLNKDRSIKLFLKEMIPPTLLVIIFTFINSTTQYLRGELSDQSYLINCFIPILSIGAMAFMTLTFIRSSLSLSRFKLTYQIPLLGPVLKRFEEISFFRQLGLLIDSGISIQVALTHLRSLDSKTHLKEISSMTLRGLNKGKSLSEIFRSSPFFWDDFLPSEKSGVLPQAFLARADNHEAQLFHQIHTGLKLIPKLIYFFILGYIAYGLIVSTKLT